MSDKRRKDKSDAYRELHNAGVPVQKHDTLRPNAGSETFRHQVAKLAVLNIGKANDYFVSSEVQLSNGYEADMILWSNPDRLTYVVECETGWTDETTAKKIERYVQPYSPIDDMLKVEVNDVPENSLDILGNVSDQLGLDL
jgi:hypothetical protein